jgi:hypothetical protein
MSRQNIVIIVLVISIILTWGVFLVFKKPEKDKKYTISTDRYYYTTDYYEIRPDGCVSFDNGVICGTYVIEVNK